MKRFISTVLAILMIFQATISSAAAYDKTDITGKPSGITVTNDGKLLVTDIWEMAIWEINSSTKIKLTKDGSRDILGKIAGGKNDGAISEASFNNPFDIIPYNDGYAISDTDNNLIRFIPGDKSEVSTIAGSGQAGSANGTGTEAEFNRPTGLTSDNEGNLYIADTDNNLIRMMDKDGNVTTFAGSSEGYTVGKLSNTRFNMPTGLCWYDNKLYIADSGNHRIVVIDGETSSVLTGGVKNRSDENELNGGSYLDGNLETATFSNPQGILVDSQYIYVADTGNGFVRKISSDAVSTLDCDKILSPRGMVLTNNRLYVCDTNSNSILAIDPSKDNNISNYKITLSKTNYTYNGKKKKPTVTVKNGNSTLIDGTDYMVAYKDNKNAGTASVIITGIDNYSGEITKTFNIKKAASKITYKKTYNKKQTSKAFNLNAKLTKGDGKLSYKSSDKKIATVNNSGKVTIKGTGTATITVTAKATTNYKKANVKIKVNVTTNQ